jgi:hypothetical protein
VDPNFGTGAVKVSALTQNAVLNMLVLIFPIGAIYILL